MFKLLTLGAALGILNATLNFADETGWVIFNAFAIIVFVVGDIVAQQRADHIRQLQEREDRRTYASFR